MSFSRSSTTHRSFRQVLISPRKRSSSGWARSDQCHSQTLSLPVARTYVLGKVGLRRQSFTTLASSRIPMCGRTRARSAMSPGLDRTTVRRHSETGTSAILACRMRTDRVAARRGLMEVRIDLVHVVAACRSNRSQALARESTKTSHCMSTVLAR